ncbi:MAG: DNA polymerase/3'-5' exonuclease PolX [Planctomycetales bacterium]|nr:DNA polymerase/3'-5' exonuclease PolX [Planctomycetales bacterium]
MPTNSDAANLLDEIADILEFQAANPFRIRAYRNGARAVRALAEPLSAIVEDEQRQLTDIDGIGKDLAEKLTTLVETGELPMLDELRAEVPESLIQLMRVPGLGPKKAAALHKELGIENLHDLRAACENEQVRSLKGFGAKTEATILEGLDLAEAAGERMYWAHADEIVQALREHLEPCEAIQRLEFAGSYRRGRETVRDLDVLVVADEPDAVMDCLAEFPAVDTVTGRGDTKMSVRLADGVQVDLRVVPAESFGAALHYFTGSKEHNVALRGLAKKRGLKINEYGVWKGDKAVAGASEEDVYAALDLPWFPPELRENRLEFDLAEAGKLPRLVELGDIRGDLHMHTDQTDGAATLEEMIEAARARGLEYIAITDHSKRVTMANGLDARRLRQQFKEIDRLNQKYDDIHVLKGVECDILERGGMDLDDDVLAEADWVVASVHYGQNQPREQITRRIVDALANPNVSVIAHPTGRLINRRKPYDVDLEAVFRAAAEHGKLLELNANPARLDLDDVACAAAKRHGIPIAISTDAHRTAGLDVMRYGILQARRAGLTKNDVANTRSLKDFKRLYLRPEA